jgi:KaiC/GvpD/RAD55 family RecA-like ATPase
MSSSDSRVRTGNPDLDALLGGGLLPGTLTVVLGATGIGKTQLGLQFAAAGLEQEGERGIVFDLTCRGDSQNHADYARRLADWTLHPAELAGRLLPDDVWDRTRSRRDYAHIFDRSGRHVTAGDLDQDAYREWKAELARKLDLAIGFFYANFVHGVRRCVVDGVEPTDKAADSFQIRLVEYVQQQILRKPHDWVARDLFRAGYRAEADRVAERAYDASRIAAVLLHTTHEVLLDDLLARPIETGDLLANANTVVLMGKVRDGARMRRALHVAKHRGSACDDDIVPYEITDRGLVLHR